MEIHERTEFRFFFPLEEEASITEKLSRDSRIRIVSFKETVVETVYFSIDPQHFVARDHYIRVRRYRRSTSQAITVDETECWLEIKTRGGTGSQIKQRHQSTMKTAFNKLMYPDKNLKAVSDQLNLPPMFPSVATQTERRRWEVSDSFQITVDSNVFFFSFNKDRPFYGLLCGELGEGKIEFKGAHVEEEILRLKSGPLKGITFLQRDIFYTERRCVECQERTKI